MRKAIAVILLCAAALSPAVLIAGASGSGIVFTVQPQGGTAVNGTFFTFSWETNVPCKCMLEMRENETYDWGAVEDITSPYSIDYSNFSSQFRLRAYDESGSRVYSDVFTITWSPAENLTMAEISVGEFPSYTLGYTDASPVPVTVKNTGPYDITGGSVELMEGSDLELVTLRNPVTIKPGESDSDTFAVRPKKGLAAGSYSDRIFFKAYNIEQEVVCTAVFAVVASSFEFSYEASVVQADFGTLQEGYTDGRQISLTVTNTGTGTLTDVHIYVGGADTFFNVGMTSQKLDRLAAGENSGDTWRVSLRAGLEAGEYEGEIKFYANELPDPLISKISVKITEEPAGGTGNDGTGSTGADGGWRPWMTYALCAFAAAAAAVTAYVLIRNKKNKR